MAAAASRSFRACSAVSASGSWRGGSAGGLNPATKSPQSSPRLAPGDEAAVDPEGVADAHGAQSRRQEALEMVRAQFESGVRPTRPAAGSACRGRARPCRRAGQRPSDGGGSLPQRGGVDDALLSPRGFPAFMAASSYWASSSVTAPSWRARTFPLRPPSRHSMAQVVTRKSVRYGSEARARGDLRCGRRQYLGPGTATNGFAGEATPVQGRVAAASPPTERRRRESGVDPAWNGRGSRARSALYQHMCWNEGVPTSSRRCNARSARA